VNSNFPITHFGRHILNQIETGITKEWIETNGLGSYAMGTVMGANTRKFHALFTLTSDPAMKRSVMVNRVEESILVNGRRFDLSCQEYPGNISPRGYLQLESFSYDPFPQWTYSVENLKLEKTFFMRSGEETSVLVYRNVLGPTVKLFVRPFFSCRDHQAVIREDPRFDRAIQIDQNVIRCAVQGQPEFFMTVAPDEKASKESFKILPEEYWYRSLVYAQEEEQELPYQEDLFSPSQIQAELAPGQQLVIVFSNQKQGPVRIEKWIEQELFLRRQVLEDVPFKGALARRCARAADQFLVSRPEGPRIVSRYPWGSDEIREALMSLPGLCLATGRIEEAKAILAACVKHFHQGLLPNRFRSTTGSLQEYTNMDVSLWWVWALQEYGAASKDDAFLKEMKPHLEKIVQSFRDGIRLQEPGAQSEVRMDSDHMISGQSNRFPLTWMNGKVSDWIATPRKGKPVEVQALWYNALQYCSEICLKFDGKDPGWGDLAKSVRDSFNMLFWNPQNNYLYDVIDGNAREGSIRPNALYAVSLPYEILETDRFKPLVETAWRHLYTSLGLRTLSTTEPHFHGVCRGNERERIAAAHNGTVMPFLIGPFLTAWFKAFGRERRNKEEAAQFLTPFIAHSSDAGLGTVSEMFDGTSPFTPRGCVADARAVAEILRVVKEEGLEL
jgi:predicted glycogen debranching enzyme